MKITKITTYYPAYLEQFYKKNKNLSLASYMEQKKELDYDGFGWADSWSHYLKPLGLAMMEIAANVKSLQYAWAKENNIVIDSRNWIYKISFQQIKKFRPDILFVDDFYTFHKDWLSDLKKQVPSLKLIIGWISPPIQIYDNLPAYDVILSNNPDQVKLLKSRRINIHYLPHAFDPRILSRIDNKKRKAIPISFIGSLITTDNYHNFRENLLYNLSKIIDINIYSAQTDNTYLDRLKSALISAVYNCGMTLRKTSPFFKDLVNYLPVLNRLDYNHPLEKPMTNNLRTLIRPAVFGLDMFQVIHDSYIALNIHEQNAQYASNMRLFEVTGIGTCLLTDWKKNLKDFFEVDKEIVTYKTLDECASKIKYLLTNKTQAKKIAKAGQEKTLRYHTFKNRCWQFTDIIKKTKLI